MQGSCVGAVLFEGWAATPEEAIRLLDGGQITLEPNHHHQTVGPMAGTISANSWVFVVENKTFGNRAYCRQVEGMQQFGDYSEKALDGLRSWRDVRVMSIFAGTNEVMKTIIAKSIGL